MYSRSSSHCCSSASASPRAATTTLESETRRGDLSSVTIKGEVGTNPEVTFDGKVEVEKTTSEVITEGDGEEIKAGDSVLAHIWIGNGFSQEKVVQHLRGRAQDARSCSPRTRRR